MNSIVIQIEDTAQQLMEYESKRDFSPEHLELIEERLDLINRLKKKYQLTFDGILQLRKQIENQWQLLEDYEGQISTAFDEKNKNNVSSIIRQAIRTNKRVISNREQTSFILKIRVSSPLNLVFQS